MGKAGTAIAIDLNSRTLNKNRKISIAELMKKYSQIYKKEISNDVKEIVQTIRHNDNIDFDELEKLEYEIRKRKKEILETKSSLQANKNSKDNSENEPRISYNQRKINNKYYWYKQFSKEGKKYTEYVKDINKEIIDIDNSSISFHPDFLIKFN